MEPLLLGPSGRPMFTEHEVEVNTCSDVPVTGPDGWKGSFLVRLTNFRFIFQDMAASRATSSSTETTTSNTPHRMLHWANIRSTAIGSSFLWFRNTNITLQLHGASNEAEGSNCVTLTLSSEQFDKFVRDMKVQSDRESWLNYPLERLQMSGHDTTEDVEAANKPKRRPLASHEQSTAMSGIGGLTKRMEEKHKQVGTSLQEAFKDMDSLFEKAREMVAIATRLSATAKTTNETPQSDEDSHFQTDILHLMGIRSPVTLGAHDNHDLYLEELSREIDTFVCKNFELLNERRLKARSKKESKSQENFLLTSTTSTTSDRVEYASYTSTNPLSTNSLNNMNLESSLQGIYTQNIKISSEVLPLTDLYCIFNRARGTALVSPEDLVQACKRLQPLRLRCRLIQLNDGVLAVASSAHDETQIARQVAHLLTTIGPLSAAQLSTSQGIGIPLASHYLLRAEAMELACRDHSSEGIIFWPNIFSQSKATDTQ